MGTIIKGNTGDWEIVIGLEVHAQIISESKLMSGSSAKFGANANEHVSIVDAAMPGMLPVVNMECIRQAVRTGIAIGSQINKTAVFARKNYFYADLPQGYQISQADKPTVGRGIITIDLADGSSKEIGIERLHVEQDAGKSLHDQHPEKSFIDLNRCGVGLMEIVSDPDISSAEEAGAYVSKIQTIVQYIGSCDGMMAEGSMRADVNVSVRKVGDTELGTRTECKNINSIRFIKQAIEIEAARQVAILEDGGTIAQETRLFDNVKSETRPLRSKEDAHDYRYFPDPDLLPVVLDDAFIQECADSLPELPDAKKSRLISDYGLSAYDASVLVAQQKNAMYFEEVAKGVANNKLAANWVISEVFGALKNVDMELEDCKITPANLGEMIALIEDDTISGKIAKDVFADMFETGKKAGEIVESKGLKQISDTGAIEAIIDEVIANNPEQVTMAKENPKLAGWFVGQVMQKCGGKANPGMVNKLLANKLK